MWVLTYSLQNVLPQMVNRSLKICELDTDKFKVFPVEISYKNSHIISTNLQTIWGSYSTVNVQ